jgi:hypothetical protein
VFHDGFIQIRFKFHDGGLLWWEQGIKYVAMYYGRLFILAHPFFSSNNLALTLNRSVATIYGFAVFLRNVIAVFFERMKNIYLVILSWNVGDAIPSLSILFSQLPKPVPIPGNGLQLDGFSPFRTLRSSKPKVVLTSSGKPLRTVNESPSKVTEAYRGGLCFSDTHSALSFRSV